VAPTSPLETFFLDSRLETLRTVLNHRSSALTIVLDRVHHPHNIAAVVRSADAFGITDVHVIGTEAELIPAISRGSERWVNLKVHENGKALLSQLRSEGFKLVLIEAKEEGSENVPVYDLPFDQKLALIFGNERDGIAEEIRSEVHSRAQIPMIGFVESLNVSVAVAITLFSSMLSGVRGERRVPLLSESEKESTWVRWLETDLRAGKEIVAELKKRGEYTEEE
jgi:tRNA (guanosine-2'-O-)-methyltransferase